MMTSGMVIATREARDACHGEADLTERLRKAMRACHRHWMETDESNQFRSALAAALMKLWQARCYTLQTHRGRLPVAGGEL